MKKRELIEQNGSDGNLKQILTVLVMNEQLFWNVVSGMRCGFPWNNLSEIDSGENERILPGNRKFIR